MPSSGLAARYTTSMPVATRAVRLVRPGRPIATQATRITHKSTADSMTSSPAARIARTRICGKTMGRRWAIPRMSSEPHAISA